MSPTLEDQERHLLVKVIDRILYKLDDLVRPYVHKILVVIEPLLIDEDYYARVEGREIISNLAKVSRLKLFDLWCRHWYEFQTKPIPFYSQFENKAWKIGEWQCECLIKSKMWSQSYWFYFLIDFFCIGNTLLSNKILGL